MIFGNALQRIADEAHAARRQIVKAAPIIIDHAVRQMGIKRVDGKIAPRCILPPVIGEGDLRVAAKALHIAAQGGDFGDQIMPHHRDRAMRDAGGHGFQAGGLHALHHLVRRKPRCQIDIRPAQPEQPVAHGAADQPCLAGLSFKCAEHRGTRCCGSPGLRR